MDLIIRKDAKWASSASQSDLDDLLKTSKLKVWKFFKRANNEHIDDIVSMHRLICINLFSIFKLFPCDRPLHKLGSPHASFTILSYDVASENEITLCIKIDKPLMLYRFSGKFMNSAFNVTHMTKPYRFQAKHMVSK